MLEVGSELRAEVPPQLSQSDAEILKDTATMMKEAVKGIVAS